MNGSFLVLITAASLTAFLAISMVLLRDRFRRRAHILAGVEDALEAHYDAVDKIFDNPAIPLRVRKAVAFLTEAMSNRDLAALAMEEILSDRENGGADEFARDLKKAFASSPEIADNLSRAIHSGCVVMFFRWPENAARFESFERSLILRRRQEEKFIKDIAKASARSHGMNIACPA